MEVLEDSEDITCSSNLKTLNDELLPGLFDHPLLSFSEASSLSKIANEIYTSDSSPELLIASKAARDNLIRSNLKLVRQIAISQKRIFMHVEVADLFQSGIIGLIRAVEMWEPSRDFQFSTYANWWIRQSIVRYTLNNYSLIRIPIHMVEKLDSMRKYLIQYHEFFGFEPETTEAADALNISEDEYLDIQAAMFEYISFEEVCETQDENLDSMHLYGPHSEVLSDPCRILVNTSFVKELNNVIDTLSEREARVIALRFGLKTGAPHTLADIGAIYGVTRERIRQIESKAMSKLRHPSRREALRDYLDLDDPRWEIFPIHPQIRPIDSDDPQDERAQ